MTNEVKYQEFGQLTHARMRLWEQLQAVDKRIMELRQELERPAPTEVVDESV